MGVKNISFGIIFRLICSPPHRNVLHDKWLYHSLNIVFYLFDLLLSFFKIGIVCIQYHNVYYIIVYIFIVQLEIILMTWILLNAWSIGFIYSNTSYTNIF